MLSCLAQKQARLIDILEVYTPLKQPSLSVEEESFQGHLC